MTGNTDGEARTIAFLIVYGGCKLHAGTAVGNLASAIGSHPEEAAVVSQLREGSEEAFAWLISKYHQPIYSLVARTIPNPEDAADLTQEIFIKIYRGIGKFHGDASLRTWIYRIALHEASNQRRWWSRHAQREITIEAEIALSDEGEGVCLKDTLADRSGSPFDAAAQQEVSSRVEAELRLVPEPYRSVVILRDIEGFSYEEIAEILATSLGTVKSRLMRGRAQLRQRLTPYVEAARRKPVSATGLLESAEEARLVPAAPFASIFRVIWMVRCVVSRCSRLADTWPVAGSVPMSFPNGGRCRMRCTSLGLRGLRRTWRCGCAWRFRGSGYVRPEICWASCGFAGRTRFNLICCRLRQGWLAQFY